IALALAYFKFRRDVPGTISATFYPLIGSKVNGPIGWIIDTIAVFATVFGVATSLGLGAIQINGGATYLNSDIPNQFSTQFLSIIGGTIVFMVSAYSGIGCGITRLSNGTIILAIDLFVFLLVLGASALLYDSFTITVC